MLIYRVVATPTTTPSSDILAPCIINGKKVYLLVDSGARGSVLSSSFVRTLNVPVQNSSVSCIGIFGRVCKSSGSVSVTVHFGTTTHKSISFPFLDLKSISPAVGIIGLDNFSRFGISIQGVPHTFENKALLMDMEDPIFHDPKAYHRSTWLTEHQISPALRKQLIEAIQPLLDINTSLSPSQFCSHPSAILHLDTGDAPPRYVAQYPLPHALIPHADRQIAKWISTGVVGAAPVNSPYNFPMLVSHPRSSKIKGKEPRVCIDPRFLNNDLPSDPRPIPLSIDIFRQIQGFKFLSEIDLAKSFTQIPIHPADRIKTTFT